MADVPVQNRSYLGNLYHGARSVLEGLAVTFTYIFRKPVTVQYPDRMSRPVVDTLPERYRGLLEVDLDVCSSCKACERDCPINCIAIDFEKVDGVRVMTRFDIDVGKCMYCGLCVESCGSEAVCPGDAEPTKAIRFTREFEGTVPSFPQLTYRFVRPGDFVPPYKIKKGVAAESRARGEAAREARMNARYYNDLAAGWALENGKGPRKPAEVVLAETIEEAAVLGRARELAAKLAPVAGEPEWVVDLLYDEAFWQTDCGECGRDTCRAYGDALVAGKERDAALCTPGGPQATRDATLVLELRAGKTPEEAARIAIERVQDAHGKR